jgi:hypothetical protein
VPDDAILAGSVDALKNQQERVAIRGVVQALK